MEKNTALRFVWQLLRRGQRLHGRCARICCFGLSALEARCLQYALSLLKVLYAMTLFSSVIPGLTRNPGGYGSNIDLDSGSEAGVTDKKTGRYDRRGKMLCRDRNREIRRSLDVFLRKRGMTCTAGARAAPARQVRGGFAASA